MKYVIQSKDANRFISVGEVPGFKDPFAEINHILIQTRNNQTIHFHGIGLKQLQRKTVNMNTSK